MRRAILQVVAQVSPYAGKCHKPFIPTKEGSYLVRRCAECGEAVPVEELTKGGESFVIQVRRSPKENT
jgi:hypothetical protein